MSEEYLRQMRLLERQEQHLISQYTDEEKLDSNDYHRIINSKLQMTPTKGETYGEYIVRLEIYCDLAAEKSRKTHIDGPRKAWYTHRSPMGCFMCEHINLVSMMLQVLKITTEKQADTMF